MVKNREKQEEQNVKAEDIKVSENTEDESKEFDGTNATEEEYYEPEPFIKVCHCGEECGDVKFCPECGCPFPKMTISEEVEKYLGINDARATAIIELVDEIRHDTDSATRTLSVIAMAMSTKEEAVLAGVLLSGMVNAEIESRERAKKIAKRIRDLF